MITTLIYPFVFSLFPVLSLYLKNIYEVRFTDVFQVCLIVLFFTAAVFLGSFVATRNSDKTSLITFLLIFFTFSFGPILNFFYRFMDYSEIVVFYPKYFASWIIIFSFFLVLILLADSQIKVLNRFLAFFSIFILSSTIVRLVLSKPDLNQEVLSRSADEEVVLTSGNDDINNLPDIYYIIMDRYLGSDVLAKKYGFDNSGFLDFLRSKGFYVADKSRSNYLRTAHSLTSSLNMEYINYLSDTVGEESDVWFPIYSLLEENKVALSLKNKGYTYIHIGSWWEPTRKSKIADTNINSYMMSEFSQNLFSNTFFNPLQMQLFSKSVSRESKERVLYEIDYLKEIPLNDKPTYTFAHFLVTHTPYVFDKNGNLLSNETRSKLSEKEAYIYQVEYANKLLEEVVNEILSKSSKKPIIIIQSDEGKYPIDSIQYDFEYNWFKASDEYVEEKLSILNAIYIPGIEENIFYPTITPVNTFRIVFNEVFDTDMDLLPDESYLHQDSLNLYKFKKLD